MFANELSSSPLEIFKGDYSIHDQSIQYQLTTEMQGQENIEDLEQIIIENFIKNDEKQSPNPQIDSISQQNLYKLRDFSKYFKNYYSSEQTQNKSEQTSQTNKNTLNQENNISSNNQIAEGDKESDTSENNDQQIEQEQKNQLTCKLENKISISETGSIKMGRIKKKSEQNRNKFQTMLLMRFRVQEFLKKLKILKNNRKLVSLNKHQLELIGDLSTFNEENKNEDLSRLLDWLENKFRVLSFIPIFQPTSGLKIFWDIFSLFYTYIFLYFYSIFIFFDQFSPDSSEFYFYSLTTLLIMIIDILVNINTAFFIKDSIITNRKIIVKEYITSKLFLCDFASVFILFYKVIFRQDNITYNPSNSIQEYLLSIIIFLKLYDGGIKRYRIENILIFQNQNKHIYRLFIQILSLVIIAHVGNNFFYNQFHFSRVFFFGKKIQSVFFVKNKASIGWYLQSLFFTEYSPKHNWLITIGIENSPYYKKYIYSLYWAITTMTTVGYGDITAQNTIEVAYILINMFIFSCVFAYNINNIGSILQDIERSTRKLQDNIFTIEKQLSHQYSISNQQFQIFVRYLKRKNISIQLKSRVRQYLNFLHEEEKNRNQSEEEIILSILSNKLRQEIKVEANSQVVKQFDIFKRFSDQTLKKVVFIMKEIVVSPNEIIFQEGDQQDHSIYLIQSGSVQVYQNQAFKSNTQLILNLLTPYQMFGELSFFTSNARTASAKSLNLSTIYKIDREEFLNIIRECDQDFEMFKMIQDSMNLQIDQKIIQSNCYSCKEIGHLAKDCPYIHQKFDRQFHIFKHNFTLFQERDSHQRRQKRQFQPMIQVMHNNLIVPKLFNELSMKKQSLLDDSYLNEIIYDAENFQSQGIIDHEKFTEHTPDSQNTVTQSYLNTEQNIQQKNSTKLKNQLYQRCLTKERFDKMLFRKESKDMQIIDRDQQNTLTIMNEEINSPKQQTSLHELCIYFFSKCFKIFILLLNSKASIAKNECSTSKKSVLSKNKSNSISKNQNDLTLTDISKIQKAQNGIEEESVSISANLIHELQQNNEIPKYYKQLPSIVTLLQPEEIYSKYTQFSHRPSIETKSLKHPNIAANGMYESEERYKQQINPTTSTVFDEKQYNVHQKGFPSDQNNQNDYSNQLDKQIYSLSKTNRSQTQIPLAQQKLIIQRISKMIQFDNNLIQALKSQPVIQQEQLTNSVFQKNFDQIKLYKFYFPQNNYDKIIRKYQLYQLKNNQLHKLQKKNAIKKRRENFCIRDTPKNITHSFFLQYLSQNTKRKEEINYDLYKPTCLSYGISFKNAKKYPIIYAQFLNRQ